MPSILINDDSLEALCEIQISDSSRSNSSDEKVTLYPNNCNIITKDQYQEEFFDISRGLRNQKSKLNVFTSLKAYYSKIKLSNHEYNLLA